MLDRHPLALAFSFERHGKHSTLLTLLLPFLSTLFFFPYPLFSQCSDAGVCAIGSKHASLYHQIGVNYVYGKSKSDDGLTFHTVQLEGTLQVFRDARLSILLPWTNVGGPSGSASGIGDVSMILSQIILSDYSDRVSVQLGGKFATGVSNSGSLPQKYQPALGTNDLLLGAAYETEPWLFALGYQLSKERSDNAATRLKRGDDFLLRAGYAYEFDEFKTFAEVLAIKRLSQSSVVVPGTNTFTDVPESDQVQVNLLGKVFFPLDERYTLQGLIALPLLNRKVNVDGLTRALTLSIGVHLEL